METLLDAAGWFGGVAVVVAYVLVSTKRISAETRTFQLLNIIGGVFLTGTALQRGALPNTVINLVWIIFGVYALTTARRTKAASPGQASQPATASKAEHGVATRCNERPATWRRSSELERTQH